MSKPLFSVVIPVYNVEQFIEKCLTTVINQTFKDFEVIIVNDGTKDNSLSICEKFAKEDKRITIISQENKGLAAARNTGAKASKGQYIINIDSDDWVDLNYLETLADIIKDNNEPDLVCLNYHENDDKLIENPGFNNVLLDKIQIEKEIYPYLIRNKRYEYFFPTAWSKAIRRDLFANNTCEKRIQVGEDGAVIDSVVTQCQTIYLSNKTGYHYRVSENSMIQNKKPRNYSDVINTYEHIASRINLDEADFRLQLDRLVAHLTFNCSVSQFYGHKYKEAKKIILENLSTPIIKSAIEHIDAKGFKGKLMKYSLKHHRIYLMKLYSYIM